MGTPKLTHLASVVSAMWRNECAEVRDYYKILAEEEKAKHKLQHPDYKCSPRKSCQMKKRKRSLDDDDYILNPSFEHPMSNLALRNSHNLANCHVVGSIFAPSSGDFGDGRV
jgi:HMG (high mobility group) box